MARLSQFHSGKPAGIVRPLFAIQQHSGSYTVAPRELLLVGATRLERCKQQRCSASRRLPQLRLGPRAPNADSPTHPSNLIGPMLIPNLQLPSSNIVDHYRQYSPLLLLALPPLMAQRSRAEARAVHPMDINVCPPLIARHRPTRPTIALGKAPA